MKKQYVMPASDMQEVCLRSCIMSGGIQKSGKDGPLEQMPSVAARRLYV